jgi:hypothetical protein
MDGENLILEIKAKATRTVRRVLLSSVTRVKWMVEMEAVVSAMGSD